MSETSSAIEATERYIKFAYPDNTQEAKSVMNSLVSKADISKLWAKNRAINYIDLNYQRNLINVEETRA
jgi:hypothetical protein